jgi:hypothetical protein
MTRINATLAAVAATVGAIARGLAYWNRGTMKASRIIGAAAALGLIAAVPTPAFALGAAQVVTSSGGVAMSGGVGGTGGYRLPKLQVDIPPVLDDVIHPLLQPTGFYDADGRWIPRVPLLAPDGNEVRFSFEFVHPKGDVTGTEQQGPCVLSPSCSTVDLRKAWAYFYEQRETAPNVWRTYCERRFNPASYSDTTPGFGTGALDDVWFDVTGCNDGLGYDFYRLHVYQNPNAGYYPDQILTDKATGVGWWSGFPHGWEPSGAAACGHKPSGGWDCYTTPGPNADSSAVIYPNVERMRAEQG